jgi:DNA-binding NtrC family response regulator
MQLFEDGESIPKTGPFTGRSAQIGQVYEQIKKAASVNVPVLLQGETGTGKEVAAHAIHNLSSYAEGPFIPVNLSALPSEIVASTLFGHEKGAFTGAVAQHKGKFEQARHGTVFLDEIESVDDNVQVSLLRLVEEKIFYRIGGKRKLKTNARLTAASNENLELLVNQGTFRLDLFYRLNVFKIVMPPLRTRRDDIFPLVAEFVMRQNKLLNKQIRAIDPACLNALEQHDWPGNVRELKNVIQRVVLLCEDRELDPDHLPPAFQQGAPSSVVPPPPSPDPALPEDKVLRIRIGTPLAEIERTVILYTLKRVENNRTEAAKLLGISRRALYNRLHKHGIA